MRRRRKPLSRLAKRKKSPTSKYWRDRADGAWSRTILDRWSRCCAVCGKPANQPHHLLSRSIPSLRHDLMNGIALCYYHHMRDRKCSPHGGPVGFGLWLMDHHPGIWTWLKCAARNEIGKADYRAAYERLAPAAQEAGE